MGAGVRKEKICGNGSLSPPAAMRRLRTGCAHPPTGERAQRASLHPDTRGANVSERKIFSCGAGSHGVDGCGVPREARASDSRALHQNCPRDERGGSHLPAKSSCLWSPSPCRAECRTGAALRLLEILHVSKRALNRSLVVGPTRRDIEPCARLLAEADHRWPGGRFPWRIVGSVASDRRPPQTRRSTQLTTGYNATEKKTATTIHTATRATSRSTSSNTTS